MAKVRNGRSQKQVFLKALYWINYSFYYIDTPPFPGVDNVDSSNLAQLLRLGILSQGVLRCGWMELRGVEIVSW